MILIISQDCYEPSTDEVIDWLQHFEAGYLRVNGEDMYNAGTFSLQIGAKGKQLKMKEGKELPPVFNIAWYRRWSGKDYHMHIMRSVPETRLSAAMLQSTLHDEGEIRKLFLNETKIRKWLTHPNYAQPSKLQVLNLARQENLDIPETLVCTRKEHLEIFARRYGPLITKDLTIPYVLHADHNVVMSKTTMLTDDMIAALPDTFYPSLFQSLIEKQYELRVFFLANKYYPMAIFSQNDEQTKVDFRNYNEERPNRTVPYKLPQTVIKKLRRLMKRLQLNTGSIDLIRSTSGQYIFLEVNPVGQFGMTSYPCNYHLEKKIAQYLIHEDEQN